MFSTLTKILKCICKQKCQATSSCMSCHVMSSSVGQLSSFITLFPPLCRRLVDFQAYGAWDAASFEQLLLKANRLEELRTEHARAVARQHEAVRVQHELPDGRTQCPCRWRGYSDCEEGYCDRCCSKEGCCCYYDRQDEREDYGFGWHRYGGYGRW